MTKASAGGRRFLHPYLHLQKSLQRRFLTFVQFGKLLCQSIKLEEGHTIVQMWCKYSRSSKSPLVSSRYCLGKFPESVQGHPSSRTGLQEAASKCPAHRPMHSRLSDRPHILCAKVIPPVCDSCFFCISSTKAGSAPGTFQPNMLQHIMASFCADVTPRR